MNIEKIKAAAEEQGYELAHAQESFGENFFGLLIFVSMSNRKMRDEDWLPLSRAADALKDGLERVTAATDPRAPEIRKSYRDEIVKIYADAGVTTVFVEEIQNQYCRGACCANRPWFRVTSSIGHIVIGWRKSVISIDWENSLIKKSGEELFPEENVTRSRIGIHAWGAAKASEYIRRLHEEKVDG